MSNRKRGIYNTAERKKVRKKLRNSATAAEAVLWTYLKKSQLDGRKFRRQSSVGPYIVDFYCAECRVVIELDGAPHYGPNASEYDQERTEYLEQAGLRVIRFENKAVRQNSEFVFKGHRRNVAAELTTPSAPQRMLRDI